MYLKENERVALFIDGANLYGAAKALGFDIDYRRLLELFQRKAYLVRALYYTAILENEEYSPIRPLVDWLCYNGYTLVTKPVKEFTDQMGQRKRKGNMDVELAVDMLELAPRIDRAVLFSGDGDFRRLVEAVQMRGVRVTVVSSIKISPPLIADELRRQADEFVDLTELMPDIQRSFEGRERRPPRAAPPAGPETEPEDDLGLPENYGGGGEAQVIRTGPRNT